MAESSEYRTVVSCMKQLETAFLKYDRDLIHFLLQEGFITEEVHDDVLNPRSMLSEHQKAGELVSGIRRKVALSAQVYHTFVDHLGQSGKCYENIVAILVDEYSRQSVGDDMQIKQSPSSVSIMSKAFSRYREYLKSYYRNHSIALDDKLSIAPCREFINLALVEKEEFLQYDEFSKSTFHGHVDEIMAAKTPLKLNALFQSDSRFILVEGPPGIGKSTLCWELCRKWDSFVSLQNFKIAVQLKLREERVQKANELYELFYHEDKTLSQRVADEALEFEGEGVVLILDGFDEMPVSVVRNENSLIMKLINSRCLPKATCLVTSRPSALHHRAKFSRDYRHVEILGFSDDSKIKYVKAAFKKSPKILSHFKSFVFSNLVIKSLMYIPLNCAIIAQVYQDIAFSKSMLPKTMTELYTILVLVLIRRNMIDIGEWDEDSEIPDKLENLPKEILIALARVSEIAYRGLFAEEVKLVFSASDVGRDFQCLGLMSVSREMYVVSGAKVTYSFFHLSMQEFLAAWYTLRQSDLILQASINYFSKLAGFFYELPPHLNVYIRTLASFVGLSKLLTKSISEIYINTTLLHCIFEAQTPIQLTFKRFPTATLNNSLDGYVFGYVLTHSTCSWDLSCLNAQSLDALLSSLHHHSQNGHIAGTIHELTLVADGCISLPLDDLSFHILQHVSTLTLSVYDFESVAALVSAMCNMTFARVYIHHCTQNLQNDHMVFKAMQTLPILKRVAFKFSGYTLSDNGMIEFNTFFLKNICLEIVELLFYNTKKKLLAQRSGTFVLGNNYNTIIESILSCPTLTSFITNIPFLATKLPSNLKSLHFKLDLELDLNLQWYFSTYTVTSLCRWICCSAGLCAKSSLQTFKILADPGHLMFMITPQNLCNFLSILNKSLNASNFNFCFNIFSSGFYSVLARTLSSRIETHQFAIKKSKSLCDLDTAVLHESQGEKQVSKAQSCPDFFDLQRLHILHPELWSEVF